MVELTRLKQNLLIYGWFLILAYLMWSDFESILKQNFIIYGWLLVLSLIAYMLGVFEWLN